MHSIQIGSVSQGTLRNEDLLETFSHELDLVRGDSKAHYKLVWEAQNRYYRDDGTDEHEEDVSEIVGELMDAISGYAPPHMYFGASQGDGADFGWWPELDFGGCKTEPLSEGKNGESVLIDLDCQIYVAINDHGNVTVKELGGAVIWDCV